MKRMRAGIRFCLASLIVLYFVEALWFSHSVAAAEPPAGSGKLVGAKANNDGTLFTAFVSVLRQPAVYELPFAGGFSPPRR